MGTFGKWGNFNLKGKKSKKFCICCDPLQNKKEEIQAKLAKKEIESAILDYQDELLGR